MGIFSWYGLTIRTKLVMIQQKYEEITRVIYQADTERFTHRRCKKLTPCQFLDEAKKQHHVKSPGVNSAIVLKKLNR